MTPSIKRYGFQAMGFPCEIQIYDESRINARNTIRQLAQEVSRIDMKYSRARPGSLISEINRSAGDKLGVKIDRETKILFDHALRYFEQSEGMYDISAGLLYRLWNTRNSSVPEQKDIDKLLQYVGLHKLSWRNSRVLMPKGMQLDLLSMVKEYAADTAANMARKMGVQSGLVNLGGTFSVIGPQPEDKAWIVGIANPQQRRSMMATMDIAAGGLSTGGDYESSFEYEGKRYSTLLNPKTGWPGTGLRAVTVTHKTCLDAGAIASIALLKEPESAVQYLQDSGLPHAYMQADGDILGSAVRIREQQQAEEAAVELE